jgi:hypothetical protein
VARLSTAPLLSDGQMALTYDCTSALAQAAQKAFNTLGLTVRDRERTAGSSVVTPGAAGAAAAKGR